MFDGVCILMSLFLFYNTPYQSRKLAFSVLFYFIVSDVIYHYFLIDFRQANNWVIYWLYNLVNIFVLVRSYIIKAHYLIFILMGLNVLLNVITSMWFVSDIISDVIYNSYSYSAGAIMIVCLFYMWTLANGNKLFDGENNNSDFINFLFRRGGRNSSGGLL